MKTGIIEPILTTLPPVNNTINTIESTSLADVESRSLPQTVEENCNNKGNFNHLVNEIASYPFAPPLGGFIWKPKWELSSVLGISGVQPSELLNSTAILTPHSNESFNKSFVELFLFKPPATKEQPKRHKLNNGPQVITFCRSLVLRVHSRTSKRLMK